MGEDRATGLPAGHKAARVRISGRVQGVWFRSWTVDEARRRGLEGWVRNRRDGTVEALFAGPARAVDDMIAACWQGPPAARVEAVAHAPAEGAVDPGFTTRPTQ
jgi:acylphosphatase